jgi:hypothetical protein
MDNRSSGSLVASSNIRPLKVGFLVHQDTATPGEIAQIVRFASGCWGGAFHAIFPTDGRKVPGHWWTLLKLLDPDVIYSLTPLDDAFVQELRREICPARLIQIDARERERLGPGHLIRDHDIGAASAYGVPAAVWRRRDVVQPPRFANVRDHWRPDLSPDQLFVVMNFGSFPGLVASDAAFNELPTTRFDLDGVEVAELLRLDASPGRLLTPLDIAASETPRVMWLPHHPWSEDCHVVIGDHLFDLLYLASRRLMAPAGHGRSTVWLPTSLAEAAVAEEVARWLTRAYWPSGGQAIATVLSYSLDEGHLEAIRANIARLTHWPVRRQLLAAPDLPFPADPRNQLRPADSAAQHVAVTDGKVLLSYRTPEFLHGPTAGRVALDATIQFRPDRYAHTNVRPHWRLPRRLDLARLFFPFEGARVTSTGLPSVQVSPTETNVWVSIPTDRAAIWGCIQRRASAERRREMPHAEPRFSDFHTSKAGLQLQGILRILGGIYSARGLFEDYYWHRVFLTLAGVERDAVAQRTSRAERLLVDFFRENREPISPDGGRLVELAGHFGRRFVTRRERPGAVTMRKLQSWFGQWRSEAIRAGGSAAEWWRHHNSFDEWRRSELNNLLEAGVMEQGCTVTCSDCGSPNWYPANRLGPMLTCPGCSFQTPLPAEPEWSFRVNELLANALDREGALAMLLALVELEHFGSDMFLFLPPQDVFERQARAAFTDVDIAFIRSGKFGIAEVKSSPRSFDVDDLERIAAVAEDWRPDTLLLAAPGTEWPAEIRTEFERLEARLGPSGVAVKPWLLSWEYPKGVLEL